MPMVNQAQPVQQQKSLEEEFTFSTLGELDRAQNHEQAAHVIMKALKTFKGNFILLYTSDRLMQK